jgi:Protein of unknown function (DUF3305)
MLAIIAHEPASRQGKHCLQIKYLDTFTVARRRRRAHNARMVENAGPSRIAPYPIAVIMERVKLANRWATERWDAKGVVRDVMPAGSGERVIVSDENLTQILFPGLTLRLHPDEAEGYIYNITSPQPKLFIMWRMRDDIARPESLSVSYHEGARWMDAEECVGGVALPSDLLPWIAEFAAEHYRPEPKKKVRYASSKDKGVASRRGGET